MFWFYSQRFLSKRSSLADIDVFYSCSDLEYNCQEFYQFYVLIDFSIGKQDKIGLLNVMLCLMLPLISFSVATTVTIVFCRH